jgi:hypothetical protein
MAINKETKGMRWSMRSNQAEVRANAQAMMGSGFGGRVAAGFEWVYTKAPEAKHPTLQTVIPPPKCSKGGTAIFRNALYRRQPGEIQ